MRLGFRRGTKPGPAQAGASISLEMPLHPRSRWGHGRPLHPELSALIGSGDARYEALLDSFATLQDDLARIPVKATDDPLQAHWHNPYFFGLDAVALYGFLALHRPGTMIEVGSGNSTMFARQAIRTRGLRMRLVSIDPAPRADIDALCDEVIRQPLEEVDGAVFRSLRAGDVLFLDGSHYVFMNSDVTVAFLEVIPRLEPGVLVHVHDVFLPSDYRPDWTGRHYAEQYLLAAFLLGGDLFDVLFPAYYVYGHPGLSQVLAPLWARLGLTGYETAGHSFWLRRSALPA